MAHRSGSSGGRGSCRAVLGRVLIHCERQGASRRFVSANEPAASALPLTGSDPRVSKQNKRAHGSAGASPSRYASPDRKQLARLNFVPIALQVENIVNRIDVSCTRLVG